MKTKKTLTLVILVIGFAAGMITAGVIESNQRGKKIAGLEQKTKDLEKELMKERFNAWKYRTSAKDLAWLYAYSLLKIDGLTFNAEKIHKNAVETFQINNIVPEVAGWAFRMADDTSLATDYVEKWKERKKYSDIWKKWEEKLNKYGLEIDDEGNVIKKNSKKINR
jgi:hypothetical protein